MQLEITYERWKATVNITDYMAGQLPFRGATPEDSDCGDSSSVDFLIEKIESTSELADPSMLSYFDSSGFTDQVEESMGSRNWRILTSLTSMTSMTTTTM